MRVIAYMHPTADGCFSAFPDTYTQPRRLVLLAEAEAAVASAKQAANQAPEASDSATEVLRAMCHAALGGCTFDTFALRMGDRKDAVDAVRRALKLIAKHDGKSAFGNDWQDALS